MNGLFERFQEFYYEHRKIVIGGGIGIVAFIALIIILVSTSHKKVDEIEVDTRDQYPVLEVTYLQKTENHTTEKDTVIIDTGALILGIDTSDGIETSEMVAKLQLYQDYNSDVYAWIYIPDTTVDLPVMYTPEDEEYYLRRDLDKKKNSYGLPFLGKGCSFDSGNAVIFGHNITQNDYAMFADLGRYEEIDFYKNHPIIEVTYGEQTVYYFIFAYYIVDNTDTNPFKYSDKHIFLSQVDFDSYIYEIELRNWLNTGYKPVYGTPIITLSSCSNELKGKGSNRMAVVAQRMDDITDYQQYIDNAALSKNPLLPEALQ